MLLDIEYTLLIYLTSLCFLSAILPAILKPLWVCLCRQSSDEQNIYREVLQLKADLASISMMNQFAAYAKLQRKIIKLEEMYKEKSQARVSKNIQFKFAIQYGLQVLLALVMIVLSLWYRDVPVVVLNQSLVPFQSFFGYPSNIPSAITPHAWVIISRVSMRSFLN